jgi:hypothetical protein
MAMIHSSCHRHQGTPGAIPLSFLLSRRMMSKWWRPFCYWAPEYGQLSEKAYIYSFGVLLEEIVSRKRKKDLTKPEGENYLPTLVSLSLLSIFERNCTGNCKTNSCSWIFEMAYSIRWLITHFTCQACKLQKEERLLDVMDPTATKRPQSKNSSHQKNINP